jgi:hydrogenase expression/formation protein HypD
MIYVDEFRDGKLAAGIAAAMAHEADPGREYRFMEFCGGHTHAISRYGLSELMPDTVRMIHGPGCPVCVLPIGRVDVAVRLVLERKVTLCTYGDALRVPGSAGMSLLRAKARGGDVRMIYSAADALTIARKEPQREVVFLALGFETTTPATAVVIQEAHAAGIGNFSVLCNHVLTPPAMAAILDTPVAPGSTPVALDGFIGPAHVSTVIGTRPYEFVPERYGKPVVIAGFEPLDLMQAVLMLIRQVNSKRAEVENEFTRAVNRDGNRKAQALMADVFELRDSFEWRGLGEIPASALRIRRQYRRFDAEVRFDSAYRAVADNKACECGAILRGAKSPQDCAIFGSVCTPENPIGACMVSAEGACAAHYAYGRFKDVAVVAQ